MHHDDQHRSQFKALCLALLAVALFALFEHGLTRVNVVTSIDFYMAYRITVTAAMFFCVALFLVKGEARRHLALSLNPLLLGRLIWKRAVITLAYQAVLAFALASSGAQALTYPLFLLHPLWQVLAHRALRGQWPDLKGRSAGLALIVLGVAVFAIEHGAMSDGSALIAAQLAALVAGAGFAWVNEYGAVITTMPRCQVLRGAPVCDRKVSSLELSTYTTYVALWLMLLALPLITAGLRVAALPSLCDSAIRTALGGPVMAIMTLGCVIITGGTWLFAEAFKRATKGPQVAALDALILPLGLAFDLASGKLSVLQPGFAVLALSALLIVGGVTWSALKERS